MAEPITRLNTALEGRYRIEREIGAGGMATVYLAEDLRHNRRVALKVLRPELAAVVGAERFLAEIETTANLTHPHILPLHDSGEADGFLFFVMPYVGGDTLRERLDREKQLPVEEAVAIARKVAAALQHAHEHGVVHRDIKPGNILLQDREPVVADFGIALAVGAAGGSRLTETGLSIGTPFYMSPEQATGDQGVGPASDTYALACVLYEMLTGEPPYPGTTAQAVLGKIIQGLPVSATAVRRSVPLNVDAAIRKALEKLPADRFGSAQDFAKALTDEGFRHGEAAREGAPGARRGLWNPLAIGASAVALVSLAIASWALLRPDPPAPVSRQVISALPAAPVVLSPNQVDVAISPDGQDIVYLSSGTPLELSVRPLDELESVPLRGPEAAIFPFISPDGEWVGFQANPGGPLQRVSLIGGPPQTIAALPADLRGGSWGADDTIVFGGNVPGGLWQVPAAGGEPRPLTEAEPGVVHWFPEILPNGNGVLFVTTTTGTNPDDDQIAVLDLRTGEHRVIIEAGSSPRYARSGHIVYAVGGTLMAVRFDPDRLEVLSDPVPVVENVNVKNNGAANFGLSSTGSLVYVSGTAATNSPRTAIWVDREGREEVLPLPPRSYQNPRLSPDGTRLAVGVNEGGQRPLWVYDVASAAGLRLTQEGVSNTPVWVSNNRLAFTNDIVPPVPQIFTVMADGSGEPERLFATAVGLGDYPTSVTPDGQEVIFSRLITPNEREILQVPLDGEPVPEPLLQGEFNRGNAEISPDGQWMVYRSDQSGPMEVYVQPYPGPGPTVPVSIGGGTSVTWSPDGFELIYRLDDRMMAVSFTVEGDTPRIGPPTELFRGNYYSPALGGTRQYHVAPDGRFLMLRDVAVQGQGEALPSQVILVQNFFEELRQAAGD